MVSLALIKAHLRIDGDEQDDWLNHLLASATAECCRYTGLSEDSNVLKQADVVNGIILAVQADFEGNPERRTVYLSAAHALWSPYCVVFGV